MELRHEFPGAAEPGPAWWRVPAGPIVAKAGGTLALLLVTVASVLVWHDPRRALVAGVAAAGVAAFTLRDLVAPVRLAADPEGVTVVSGYARRVRLPWSAVEAVRVDERSRYGVRAAYLEVDAGESIHVYSAYDLGTPLDEVAATLCALRAAGSTGEPGAAYQRQDDQ